MTTLMCRLIFIYILHKQNHGMICVTVCVYTPDMKMLANVECPETN